VLNPSLTGRDPKENFSLRKWPSERSSSDDAGDAGLAIQARLTRYQLVEHQLELIGPMKLFAHRWEVFCPASYGADCRPEAKQNLLRDAILPLKTFRLSPKVLLEGLECRSVKRIRVQEPIDRPPLQFFQHKIEVIFRHVSFSS
jgi:hypothetical protein